jgi:predicted ArsR family transcriptional regulator
MLDIQVIDDPAAATVALEPMRSRLLSELAVPASAATLATRVGLARQKVNYHLHALEAHGLVRPAQERKWGGPKYHDETAPGGRAHRLVVVAHPLPQKFDPKEPS